MRQLLIGGISEYPTDNNIKNLGVGAIGVAFLKDGEVTISQDGTDIGKTGFFVLGQKDEDGGTKSVPFYVNNFSYVKATYKAGSKFDATVTVNDPVKAGEYTLIVAKKGVGLNDRYKFTASTYVDKDSVTKEDVAKKLASSLKAVLEYEDVTVTAASEVITIKANEKGVDFELICADNLESATVAYTTRGADDFAGTKFINELALKEAASFGYNYTEGEGADKLYKKYPIDTAQKIAINNNIGFVIYTIKFSELSEYKTTNTPVNQVVQLIMPTSSNQQAKLEEVLKELSKR